MKLKYRDFLNGALKLVLEIQEERVVQRQDEMLSRLQGYLEAGVMITEKFGEEELDK